MDKLGTQYVIKISQEPKLNEPYMLPIVNVKEQG